MSADTDARRLERDHPKRVLYEHILLSHNVRLDRRRYLPGMEELGTIHDAQHKEART